jgi:hypothetical protein
MTSKLIFKSLKNLGIVAALVSSSLLISFFFTYTADIMGYHQGYGLLGMFSLLVLTFSIAAAKNEIDLEEFRIEVDEHRKLRSSAR